MAENSGRYYLEMEWPKGDKKSEKKKKKKKERKKKGKEKIKHPKSKCKKTLGN